MLKIVVFDCGIGGALFSEYIEKELSVVEVIRAIDRRHGPYGNKNCQDILTWTEATIRPHIGRADVIVLASYEATAVCLATFRQRYPNQCFVGFEPGLSRQAPRAFRTRRVLILASPVVRASAAYQAERAKLAAESKVLEPDISDWAIQSNLNTLTADYLRQDLVRQQILPAQSSNRFKPSDQIDLVLNYQTSFSDLADLFEQVLGWQALMVDDFQNVYRMLCGQLKLVGLDGRKPVKNNLR